MSRLIRWEPNREAVSIRESMDNFMNGPMGGRRGWPEGANLHAVDLYQTDDEVVVKAVLPGIRPNDISISVAGDVLNLRGSVTEEVERQDATYSLHERRHGEFSWSLPLPAPVAADKTQAVFEKGVSALTLPKAAEVKPKTIAVKARLTWPGRRANPVPRGNRVCLLPAGEARARMSRV